VALMKRSSIVGERLVYRMKKTGKERNIRLLPPALRVVRRHLDARPDADSGDLLFPILVGKDLSTERKRITAIANADALGNKYLKKIARQAGIDATVSFHVARHSFATIALRKGWDVAEISQALGHSSLKATEQYLKGFDDTDLDDKMSDLFTSDGGEE
jgi:integrase